MRSAHRLALFAFATTITLAACGKGQELHAAGKHVKVPLGDPSGGAGGPVGDVDVTSCTGCHGDATVSVTAADQLVAAAPPVEPQGASSSVIGAHQAHLRDGAFSRALECASCHLIPQKPGPHNPAKVVFFSRLATKSWSGTPIANAGFNTGTCSNVYCHGNFENGKNVSPVWTAGPVACGSCHAVSSTNGPGGTHPDITAQGGDCGACHPGYTPGTVNLALHLNGKIDGGGHPAGWKEPDQHGLAAISFTGGNGGLTACATCHVGFGPANGDASTSCNACHATPSAYGPFTTGTYPNHADWQTECTFCHGKRDNTTGAPPRDTHVISSNSTPQPTTLVTVGAHTSHVGALHGISAQLSCLSCHPSVSDLTHIDGTSAIVSFGSVGGTANPGTYASPTCSANYCHGNFTGGSSASLAWNGGTFSAGAFTLNCTSCHGNPPPASVGHPQNDACASCHGAGYSKTGATTGTVSAANHVNGVLNLTGTEGCTSCHGTTGRANAGGTGGAFDANQAAAPPIDSHGASSGVRVGVHQAHVNPAAGNVYKPIACTECHPNNTSNRHANGTTNVTFAAATGANLASYSPSFTLGNGTSTQTSCAVYCHGASLGAGYTGSVTTWTWNGAAATCGSCHGDPPSTAGHSGLTSASNCGACHPGYTATTVNLASHINGQLDGGNPHPAGWKEPDQHGLTATSFTSPNNGLASCTSCHTSFGPAGGASGAASSSCNACHASPSTYGPYTTGTYPNHTNWQTECTFCHGGVDNATGAPPRDTSIISSNGTTQPTTLVTIGAHSSHVGALHGIAPALACRACHPNVTDLTHIDGNSAIVSFGPVGATTNAGTYASPTCSANYCHGNFTGGSSASLAWTGTFSAGAFTLTCTSCHGNPPPASVGHPQNDACASCHGTGYSKTGATTGTVNAATHVNGVVNLTGTEGCTSCHGTAGRANGTGTGGAFDANQAAAPPIDSHGGSTGVRVGVHQAHVNPAAGNVYKPIACTECHPNNTSNRHANGTTNVTFAAATGANLASYSPTFTLGNGTSTQTSCAVYCHGASLAPSYVGSVTNWTWNGAAATCGSCHGDPPATIGHTSQGVTSATNCGTCHPGYSATTVSLTLHINGQLDGGESSGGTACAGCHATIWNLMNGTTATGSRHRLGAVAGTNDSPTDSGQLWNPQSALTNVAPASRSCVNMCHGDHPHDLNAGGTLDSSHSYNLYVDPASATSRANGTASRTVAIRANEDFDPVANTGVCVRCHAQPIVAGGITVTGAAYGGSAHDFTSTLSPAASWQYTLHNGTTLRNCTKCHASRAEGTTPTATADSSGAVAVHGTQDDSLLAGLKRASTTPFVCWNCHGSTASPANGAQGNRSGKPIQAQSSKAHPHPVASDTVHDSVAERSGAAFGNALGGKARHVNCMDCHDEHAAKAGAHTAQTNLAGPALQGAWGPAFTGTLAAWTAPTAGVFTVKTIVAGTDLEATLCFKCHTAFYGTLPTAPSSSPAFTETDVLKEFNTANVAFHPVLATNAGTLGNTGNVISPWTRSSKMTCSDCHGSDTTTDPTGPHGSAAAFMLKGPNTVWNNTIAIGSGGMPANTFCINCHNANFSGGRFGNHTNGAHNLACMNCHAAIPHGGPRPGMLVAPAGAAAASGSFPGVVSGWDTTAPYSNPGSGSRLYLKSYPANNATSWAQSNCGCNGTGH